MWKYFNTIINITFVCTAINMFNKRTKFLPRNIIREPFIVLLNKRISTKIVCRFFALLAHAICYCHFLSFRSTLVDPRGVQSRCIHFVGQHVLFKHGSQLGSRIKHQKRTIPGQCNTVYKNEETLLNMFRWHYGFDYIALRVKYQ